MKSPSIFFWSKRKKQTFVEKIKEALPVLIEELPKIRKLMRGNVDPEVRSNGEIVGQMYDFYQDADGFVTTNDMTFIPGEQKKDERLPSKPVQIQGELEVVPTSNKPSLENLDEKINLLKDKSKLVNQRFVSNQLDGMIKRLENRKRYHEEAAFYEQFPRTTDEMIDKLLAKYKVMMAKSELFVPTFPKEAIDVMKKYSEVTEKITSEKPVFYVIAEDKDFEKKTKRLDPILLAQSPFGFYFDILGAWDKEMILLSEL